MINTLRNFLSRKDQLRVEGITFHDIAPTESKTHSVGYANDFVIKIENEINAKKLLSLDEEASIIKRLNESGCVSCPKLRHNGQLPDGRHFLIMDRIRSDGKPGYADILLSLIEQKAFGVYQGDVKWSNMALQNGICFLIDYDQAQVSDNFSKIAGPNFLNWIANDFGKRRGTDFFNEPSRMFNREAMESLFEGTQLNISSCSLLEKQITTDTESGIYHKIETDAIFTRGARTAEERIKLLELVEFSAGESILDVGCNLGLMTQYFAERGCNAAGVDMDPYVVKAAQIIANASGVKAKFEFKDVSESKSFDKYDTVSLFSVLHHVENMERASKLIASCTRRLLIEAKLVEVGSVPRKGEWVRTNSWKFDDPKHLGEHLASLFPKFLVKRIVGQCDRDRFIFELLKSE